mgnify:CR=1 FL=1
MGFEDVGVAGVTRLRDGALICDIHVGNGRYENDWGPRLIGGTVELLGFRSDDGGQTWKNLRISQALPDGGGYNRGYGMKGGLTRLPVKDRDVLIFSNADTAGGDRSRMSVWASFDGGQTWPVKRLVYESFSAYSSLVAGRPGTPTEGQIFLLFEGGPKGRYSAMQLSLIHI